MKYLVLLEGKCEEAMVQSLIDTGRFAIPVDDMLDERPFLGLSIKRHPQAQILIRQLMPEEKVKVVRIGDTLSDNISIPKDLKKKIDGVENYCTKPEIEMLLIINEGLYDDYQKVKNTQKPKLFAKSHITYKGKKYKPSYPWLYEYFTQEDLVSMLQEYKRLSNHEKEERHVYDLVKEP